MSPGGKVHQEPPGAAAAAEHDVHEEPETEWYMEAEYEIKRSETRGAREVDLHQHRLTPARALAAQRDRR